MSFLISSSSKSSGSVLTLCASYCSSSRTIVSLKALYRAFSISKVALFKMELQSQNPQIIIISPRGSSSHRWWGWAAPRTWWCRWWRPLHNHCSWLPYMLPIIFFFFFLFLWFINRQPCLFPVCQEVCVSKFERFSILCAQ